jgi:hypothetical protein
VVVRWIRFFLASFHGPIVAAAFDR